MTLNIEDTSNKVFVFPNILYMSIPRLCWFCSGSLLFWAAGLNYEQPRKQVEQSSRFLDKLSTRIIRDSRILSPSDHFHGFRD